MLKVNNVELPTPKSVEYGLNKIWSENTGRLDSGFFVGDLIATKRKYEVTFPALNPTQYTAVKNAFNVDFAEVQITNEEGGTDTVQAYFGDLQSSAYSWHNNIKYAINAKISIIER